jgi:chromosome partitioning protein
MNRARPGTRLGVEVAQAVAALGVAVADAQLTNRVAYAETLGQGLGGIEGARAPALRAELDALTAEVLEIVAP